MYDCRNKLRMNCGECGCYRLNTVEVNRVIAVFVGAGVVDDGMVARFLFMATRASALFLDFHFALRAFDLNEGMRCHRDSFADGERKKSDKRGGE